jgi:hypothetical protein
MRPISCKCDGVPFNGQKWGDKRAVSHFFGISVNTVEHWIERRPAWLEPYLRCFPPTTKGSRGLKATRWLFDLHGLENVLRSNRHGTR